jgi:hypothetical protein
MVMTAYPAVALSGSGCSVTVQTSGLVGVSTTGRPEEAVAAVVSVSGVEVVRFENTVFQVIVWESKPCGVVVKLNISPTRSGVVQGSVMAILESEFPTARK